MGCCGGRRKWETNGQRPAPRYRYCLRCKGPVYRRLRYDAKLRCYDEVDICPVCDREAVP